MAASDGFDAGKVLSTWHWMLQGCRHWSAELGAPWIHSSKNQAYGIWAHSEGRMLDVGLEYLLEIPMQFADLCS